MSSFSVHRGCRSLISVVGLSALACGSSSDSAPRVALSAATPLNMTAPGEAAQPAPSPLPPLARAALDSGNAQLRAKRYDAALTSYRTAVKEAPGHIAPEFGIYMTARRQGNTALADSALRIINAHTGGAAAWTDSAMRRAHGEHALPPAHPAL
ncbi:MAG: hypothetical protein JWO39_1104 [Gemmatimonadetes bacterium]|nr:hypothetical protein [Gemmatimonadota bacterium]